MTTLPAEGDRWVGGDLESGADDDPSARPDPHDGWTEEPPADDRENPS